MARGPLDANYDPQSAADSLHAAAQARGSRPCRAALEIYAKPRRRAVRGQLSARTARGGRGGPGAYATTRATRGGGMGWCGGLFAACGGPPACRQVEAGALPIVSLALLVRHCRGKAKVSLWLTVPHWGHRVVPQSGGIIASGCSARGSAKRE